MVNRESGAATTTPSEFVNQEFASTWQWRIDTDPELAAALGMLSRRRSKHALDPRSLESFHQRLEWVERALERIQTGISPDQVNDLPPEDQLSHELYVMQLTDYVHYTRKHKAFLCCVNRLEGPQIDLPLHARYLPLKSRADREFYRDFLRAIPKQLKEVESLLRAGIKENRTPPQVSMSGVVEQLRSMLDGSLQAFSAPTTGCFRLPDEQQLQTECHTLIEGEASQAFVDFAMFLEKEYTPNLRTEISASRGYPNGSAYYIDCLRFHTTTTMTPAEVHDLGVREVNRVRSEMEAIAAVAGYEGRLGVYLEHLRTAPEFEPTSEASLLAHYRDIVGRLSPALLRLFHLKTLPRQPLEITATPVASASMAPAAYYLAGSTDSNAPRPGMFYVNTSELPTRRTFECEALALHEAIPGHHTQGAIQGESPLPEFRCYQEDRRYFEAPCRFPFYTGYIEGWGLHSETLGEELGLYEHPTDKFGQLSMEAIRCCRLVVDTGMHALDWTQEQAVQFMLENTAVGEHDARTEVSRYITWPGQATAYKVGERFIRRLRTLAESELGDDFDSRDFYDVVLLGGAVPLNVLEERVSSYVAKIKNGDRSPGGNIRIENVHGCDDPGREFAASMTFANWCKCCIVPGSCQSTSF